MFHVHRAGDEAVVEISGEIDLGSCRQFAEILASDGVVTANRVIVSLLACTYIDSSCIGSLVGAQKRLNRGLVLVAGPGTMPAKILKLASLGTYFRVRESMEEARAAA